MAVKIHECQGVETVSVARDLMMLMLSRRFTLQAGGPLQVLSRQLSSEDMVSGHVPVGLPKSNEIGQFPITDLQPAAGATLRISIRRANVTADREGYVLLPAQHSRRHYQKVVDSSSQGKRPQVLDCLPATGGIEVPGRIEPPHFRIGDRQAASGCDHRGICAELIYTSGAATGGFIGFHQMMAACEIDCNICQRFRDLVLAVNAVGGSERSLVESEGLRNMACFGKGGDDGRSEKGRQLWVVSIRPRGPEMIKTIAGGGVFSNVN
jgi:hypothetical protein